MTKKQKLLENFMWVLRGKGYGCNPDGNGVGIDKDGVKIMSLGDRGKFTSHNDISVEYTADIWEVQKNVRESYNLYYKAEQVEYEHLNHYRKLADYNGVILAARMRSDSCLEFATWEKAHINSQKGTGNYFEYYGHAKEDFAVRAGLIDKNNLIPTADNTPMKDNERKELPMLENHKFISLLQAELKRQGYECTLENGEVKVTKNGFNITDILVSGEHSQYRIYKNTLNDYEYQQVRAINESMSEAYRLYEQGEPLAAQPLYRKLCELGNYVLAVTGKLIDYGYMEYATWKQDADKTGVDAGNYFTDYEAAKEDFALRCGLIDRNKLFSETEMKLIRQGLVHLGVNYPDLTFEQNTLLGKVVEKIEMIVPEIQERDHYEAHDLIAEDGLEM
jgi:hypothetical protein